MNTNDSNNPNQNHSDAALDALVEESLAVEVDPERVERLTHFWREQLRQQVSHRHEPPQRWTWWTAGLVAASLLIAGGLMWRMQQNNERQLANQLGVPVPAPKAELPDQRPGEEHPLAVEDQTAVPLASDLPATETKLVVVDARSAGREPTPLERFMFAAATGRQTQTPAVEPESRSLATAEPVPSKTLEPVPPEILELVSRSSPAEVAQFVLQLRQETDQAKRRSQLQQLLEVENQSALVAYLSLLRDETLDEQALLAAVESQAFPVERLVALLDHEEKQVQWMAARLLAVANRCEMTEPLIARIHEQPSDSTPAWFTLFTCRCERADEFLAYASQRPQLLGQFNNARLQWQRMGQGSL